MGVDQWCTGARMTSTPSPQKSSPRHSDIEHSYASIQQSRVTYSQAYNMYMYTLGLTKCLDYQNILIIKVSV